MSWTAFDSCICIGGLPGKGNVGKLAADRISKTLECHTVKSFTSLDFPPLTMLAKGVVRPLQVELKAAEGRKDILVLCGDAQPLTSPGMYQLAGLILKEAKSFGVTDFITLAAYVGSSDKDVVGVATDADLAKEMEHINVELLHTGIIGGLNGILVGICPNYGMRGACLMGNTAGDASVDSVAAINLIQTVGQILDLDISLDGLVLEGQKEISEESGISDNAKVISEDDEVYMAYR